MKSKIPKVLHTIGGRSLVGHAMAAARSLEPAHLAVVVRHEREQVAAHIAEADPAAIIADQDEEPGTGRACECGLEALPADLTGTVLVTMGDVPLLEGSTLAELTRIHEEASAAVTLLSAVVDDAGNYGRVVRDEAGQLLQIMERKDAEEHRRRGDEFAHVLDITEYNSGIYAFDAEVLRSALGRIEPSPVTQEKYLTDVIKLAREEGRVVLAHPLQGGDLVQTEGVNDKAQLADLGRALNAKNVEKHMKAGVIVVDPATTWIDVDVSIGQDAVIRPNTQLLGATTVGEDAVIGPDTTLTDTEVGDGASVVRTQAEHAVIGPRATVGPFSYLRPGTVLGEAGKIGGFVETKNAEIGPGAKVPHLTYCGDATIGEGANIGAGTIFANYDGVNKHHTHVGRYSFVGSDSVLVAPVDIGDGAYVAAGSTVEGVVEPGQIAVARGRQRNIDGWVARRRSGTKTADAADAARAAGARHVSQTPDASTPEATHTPTQES